MNFDFDPAKEQKNLSKHGISLQMAAEIEWDSAICWPDTRRNYGEARMAAIGYIGLRLYVVVFVDRDDMRRIISLRKANKKEVNRYAET